MLVGYARVSTADQKLDAQLDALRAAGCVIIYSEKMSGATTERPELQRLLSQIRPGEVLLITALDRLARSATDLLQLARTIRHRGAHLRSLREPWCDTATPMGEFLLTVLSGVAELERALISERAAAGRKSAKSRGVRFGRKPKLDEFRRSEATRMLREGQPVGAVAKLLGVSRWTLARMTTRQHVDTPANDT